MFPVTRSFQSFGRLYGYLRRQRSTFYAGCFFSFLKKFFDVAPEILIGVVIDVVVNRENSFLARWGVVSPMHQLVLLSTLTLLIWVAESACEYMHQLKWRGLAQTLQHHFRVDAYSHLQRLDLAVLEEKSSGSLVAVLNDDINQLERFFNEGMNNFVQILTSTVLIGAVFFTLAPEVAVFAFLPMPFIFLGAFYFQKRVAPLYSDVREQAGRLANRLSNNIGGMTTIRSFTTEDLETARVTEDSLRYRSANERAILLSARFNPLIRMGVLAGFLATFVMGGYLALTGQLPVGSYGVLVFLSQRLLWPLRDLAATVDLFERAMASADRVLDLLSTPVGIELKARGVPLTNERTEVHFENVNFAYSNGVPVLKDLNLTVPDGKTVAIVGATGSGKSTLTKLLLRFYTPTTGTIRLGGSDILALDPQRLRQRIGLVSQDVFLFEGTIFENIAYGSKSATRADVEAAARRAYADEFIRSLPEGFETPIGERGQKLSGGQRQRLSIARALLKNPPVLVFDEATSAVDNETESLIQRSLRELSLNRTTLIIAHRLSTVVHADVIYVLAKGEIAEWGTHAELLARNGTYSQLWSFQVRRAERPVSS